MPRRCDAHRSRPSQLAQQVIARRMNFGSAVATAAAAATCRAACEVSLLVCIEQPAKEVMPMALAAWTCEQQKRYPAGSLSTANLPRGGRRFKSFAPGQVKSLGDRPIRDFAGENIHRSGDWRQFGGGPL